MMELIHLAVVSDEEGYGEAVCRGLAHICTNFTFHCFSGETFRTALEEDREKILSRFTLILWDGPDQASFCQGSIVYLDPRVRGEAGDIYRQQGEAIRLPKYCDAGTLLRGIFRVMDALGITHPQQRSRDVQVIAFASWQGGSGCTTLALATGQDLVRYDDRRVLYLSLDPIEGAEISTDQEEGIHSMAAYLYRLLGSARRIKGLACDKPLSPQGYLLTDSYGLQAFPASPGRNPLPYLSEADMENFLLHLMGCGLFDVIMLDLGTCAGPAAEKSLALSDRLVLVERYSDPRRKNRYLQSLQGEGRPLLLVRNCADSRQEASPDAAEDMQTVCVASRGAEDECILLEGSFGLDIHQLAELCYTGNEV